MRTISASAAATAVAKDDGAREPAERADAADSVPVRARLLPRLLPLPLRFDADDDERRGAGSGSGRKYARHTRPGSATSKSMSSTSSAGACAAASALCDDPVADDAG